MVEMLYVVQQIPILSCYSYELLHHLQQYEDRFTLVLNFVIRWNL